MTRSVRTVTAETTASEVARLFVANGIGSAIVVGATDETDDRTDIVGIVTESDIIRQVAIDADVGSVRVGSFMTAPVVTVESMDSIDTAATLMRDHSIRRLPVVDVGELVGVVTTTNLAHYVPRLRDAIVRARAGPDRE